MREPISVREFFVQLAAQKLLKPLADEAAAAVSCSATTASVQRQKPKSRNRRLRRNRVRPEIEAAAKLGESCHDASLESTGFCRS